MADMDHQPMQDLSGMQAVEMLRDIGRDPRVSLVVQNSSKHEYAHVSGRATIHRVLRAHRGSLRCAPGVRICPVECDDHE
jgi:hypothetical protein